MDMKIWAHTMVKNEANWLWYSVTSVIEYVDKLLLWDTGSTDNTLDIVTQLQRKYPNKIIFNKKIITTSDDFTKIRQEMLDATKSDWFLMIDGDEIWWEDSIKKVISSLSGESIVVPTINLVGDIYHYQDRSSGRYSFGNLKGHYNLRVIKRDIPGLHSQGVHGVWGWADGNNKMIQERGTYKFIDAPYLHATNIPRSNNDIDVIKRAKKIKYELGNEFPRDFYYPESFFKEKPEFVPSPWKTMPDEFKFRAFFETPFRKFKRKIWQGSPGY